ncbi:MAG TPA: carboxypeptidase-like regulatory domain-containing protein [Pyrinomonadaceae bacterium]|nr:carboxypeptidase-like regulatory domain-containing protein [Pyrinomonadaceae bacterium]
MNQRVLRSLLSCITLSIIIGVGATTAPGQQPESSTTTGKITGRVVNENGEPIPHAAVTLFAYGTTQRLATTDDSGNFEVTQLDPRVYTIIAASPAHYTPLRDPDSVQPIVYHVGDSANITLIKGAVITGTVTSTTGEPVVQAGVRVLMIRDANGKPVTSVRYPDKVTDDRGIYRIYGLVPGTYLVSAGGRGAYGFNSNAYDSEAPTFAPSSSPDTAAEIVVHSSEEVSGVDIHLRGEPGHVVSGTISGTLGDRSATNVLLRQLFQGVPQVVAVGFQPSNGNGFALYGIADGDYELTAQEFSEAGAASAEPVKVAVKGKDASGLNLVLKSLGAISGRVVMEGSAVEACKDKQQPLLSETVLWARVNRLPNQPAPGAFTSSQSAPDKSGEFTFRNLGAGQFNLSTVFFANHWYLRSIKRPAPAAKGASAARDTDIARQGLNLKFGERVSGVIVTLAGGAVSLRGSLKLPEGASVPPKLYVHLVPAEEESAEDVLRFYTVSVSSDAKFALNNLAPGKYWVVARLSPDNEPEYDAKLRAPEGATQRAALRKNAEASKIELELKPCQNVSDYQVPFEISAGKN